MGYPVQDTLGGMGVSLGIAGRMAWCRFHFDNTMSVPVLVFEYSIDTRSESRESSVHCTINSQVDSL